MSTIILEQLRDARIGIQILETERDAIKAELAAVLAENVRYRTALRWYAGDGSTYDGIDVGQRARAALATVQQAGEEERHG